MTTRRTGTSFPGRGPDRRSLRPAPIDTQESEDSLLCNRAALGHLFRLLLVPCLIVIAGAILYSRTEAELLLAKLQAEESLEVALGSTSLTFDVHDIAGDMRYLANVGSSRVAIDDPSPVNLQLLADTFVKFGRHDPLYDQIRWIDEHGIERVRVNQRDGVIGVAPPEQLQRKGDHFYFRDAIDLNPGEIYVSPLDLNVENDAVEIPYRPTVRVATPVTDSRGIKRGIFIVNYSASEALKHFKEIATNDSDQIFLLDGTGQWLSSPDKADEWGSMFHRTDNFATRYPAAWKRMSSAENGKFSQFEDEYGLWTFRAIRPLGLFSSDRTSARSSRKSGDGADPHRWVVVAGLPASAMASARLSSYLRAGLGAVVMLGMLGVVARRETRAMMRKRKAKQDLLRRSAELQEAQRIARLGSWEWTRATDRVSFSNDVFWHVCGVPDEGPIGRSKCLGYCSKQGLRLLRQVVAKALREHTPFEVDLTVRSVDGSNGWITVRGEIERDRGDRVVGIRGTIQDTTERKATEHERAQQSSRIVEMSRHLVTVHEDVQRQMASELHDRTSSNLAALKIDIDVIAGELPKGASKRLELRVEDLRALVDDTSTSIREICSDLRPPLLDYAGLFAALSEYARQFERRTGVSVEIQCKDGGPPLLPDVDTQLFRIAQEALTNCAKHARAKAVSISLAYENDATVLTISDDGIGFDLASHGAVDGQPGLGLLTMRERAAIIGGRFSLGSSPGKGTHIVVSLAQPSATDSIGRNHTYSMESP